MASLNLDLNYFDHPKTMRIVARLGRAYDPPKSRAAKNIVKMIALSARPKDHKPSDYSFCIEVVFYGPHWGADLDNLTKLVLDGMKGVFWKDDHQVVELYAKKIRVPKTMEKTVVSVEELSPEAFGKPCA